MLVTLGNSLLDLCKRDAGNGVVDIAVVFGEGEECYDGGAEVMLLQMGIGCSKLRLVLEEVLRLKRF